MCQTSANPLRSGFQIKLIVPESGWQFLILLLIICLYMSQQSLAGYVPAIHKHCAVQNDFDILLVTWHTQNWRSVRSG